MFDPEDANKEHGFHSVFREQTLHIERERGNEKKNTTLKNITELLVFFITFFSKHFLSERERRFLKHAYFPFLN